MSDKNIAVLEKVLEEMGIARSMISGYDMAAFLEDEMVKRAVCMTVINVGELIKNLDMDFRAANPDVPWRDMAGFRDIAAHKYQTLRMEDVYVTVADEFATIAEDIQKMCDAASLAAESGVEVDAE